MRGFLQWSNGVGLRDGAIVGALGEVVGESVGDVDGDADGLTVGDVLGEALGLTLGLDVGASVLHLPSEVPAKQAPRLLVAGAVHSREPRQSLSRQHPSPVAHLPGQCPPPSIHVSRCVEMLSRSLLTHSDSVGDVDGAADGLALGEADGAGEGDALGEAVGLALGDEVGANVLHAPSVSGSKGEHATSGLLHSREPSQSESRQHPSSKPQLPGHDPPPSTHVSKGSFTAL